MFRQRLQISWNDSINDSGRLIKPSGGGMSLFKADSHTALDPIY